MIAIFKRLLIELKPFRKQIVIIMISGFIMSMAQGQLAVLLKNLLDSLQSGDRSGLYKAPLFIVLAAVIQGLSRYVHFLTTNLTVERVVQNFREKLQSKFMVLNLSFYNQYQSGTGGLLSRILNDISLIQTGLRNFADLIREPFLLVFLIGWLFYLNWKLTLFVFVVLPLLLGFLKNLARSIAKYSHHGQESLEGLTSTVKESLDGIRVIQSFSLETEMRSRFQRIFERYFQARKSVHSRVEAAGPITEIVATFIGVGILLYMALEIDAGRATYGDFASYLASLLMLNKPIKVLQDAYIRFQETMVASERVFSILDETREVPAPKDPKPFPENWKTIRYENVSFAYGAEKPVLANVNFTIHRGQKVAFVGASGSGKSTLVNLLERFFDPQSGQILIDERPINEIGLLELRKNIALVTQDVFLFSDTVERNIHSGDFTKPLMDVVPAAKAAYAHDFIMKTPEGYQTRMGERGNLFSGGEKQRISIARALFKNAPILILDEATSALDSESEAEVQTALEKLMEGRTSLVIAHRLSTIQNADCIFVMKNGQLVESGTHQELLARAGEYAKLFEMQMQSSADRG